MTCGGQILPETAEPQYFHAASDVGERGIDRHRRFEREQRVDRAHVVAAERARDVAADRHEGDGGARLDHAAGAIHGERRCQAS